jgi:amino acid adenylation domain-containing protein
MDSSASIPVSAGPAVPVASVAHAVTGDGLSSWSPERVAETFAAQAGLEANTVLLAARSKVAAVLTCTPELLAGTETWRDLLEWAATPVGRAAAEAAWHGVAELDYVDAERVRGYLLTALTRLAESPGEPHCSRGLLGHQELAELKTAATGPVRPLPDHRFHELFEQRVRRHPDAVAAVQGSRSWTYAEVNRNANLIARALHDGGLGAEDVVAVVTGRTLEWLAAVIGVFKAGGCYLPLEPGFPAARISAVLDRSECRAVLAAPRLASLDEALAGRPEVTVLELGDLLATDRPAEDLGLPVSADQLAYIYFTSGSTGEPKGAMCEHGGFLNHLLAKIEDMGVVAGGVVAQTAPQCFDISLWQLVAGLLVGGRTLIVEQEVLLDVRRFIALLDTQRVEVAQLVPTYLDLFLATMAEDPRPLPALRTMAVTGEALKRELVQRWFAAFPDITLVDCYGTTEASDDTNHGIMHSVPEHRSVPLGAVIRNVRVYLVDDHLQLVPRGVQGEIVFAGICVGRGYVNDPERTRAAYARDPLKPEDRLYRTGDYGRLLPSGRLEYLGRRDSQVKVSGFRIEIGEIENQLLRVPGVRDGAVVIARSAGEPQLIAYYTGTGTPEPGETAQVLGQSLPEYMVPRRLYRLDRLPLSDNGKVDRRELTRLAEADTGRRGEQYLAPVTETERDVARLWSDLLKVPADRIGRDTHFAEIGGTSLAAIRMCISLGRIVSVTDLSQISTVADVADLIDGKRAAAGRPVLPASPQEEKKEEQ